MYMDWLTKNSYFSTLKTNGKDVGMQYINSKLKIINYGKIIELSDKKLNLSKVVVTGSNLKVLEMDKNYLVVRGRISCITLID